MDPQSVSPWLYKEKSTKLKNVEGKKNIETLRKDPQSVSLKSQRLCLAPEIILNISPALSFAFVHEEIQILCWYCYFPFERSYSSILFGAFSLFSLLWRMHLPWFCSIPFEPSTSEPPQNLPSWLRQPAFAVNLISLLVRFLYVINCGTPWPLPRPPK